MQKTWLLQPKQESLYTVLTWISVSNENNTSESSRWCMYDHLNSGILNGGLVGPGLNIGLVDPDFGRCCLESISKFRFSFSIYK